MFSFVFCTVVDAALGEIITTCSKMEWVLKYGERALRPSKRRTPLILIHKSSKVYYEPLGIVAAIVSWNYRTKILQGSLNLVALMKDVQHFIMLCLPSSPQCSQATAL